MKLILIDIALHKRFPVDLVTFTEKIPNEKLQFLFCVLSFILYLFFSFFIFYYDNYHFKEQSLIKPCLFHWDHKLWGYISLAPEFLFYWGYKPCLLELYLNIEHIVNSLLLFSISHIVYLGTTTERCSLKDVFFKTQETRYTE